MDIELVGDTEGRITRVAASAAADAGLALEVGHRPAASAWWRAGIVAALERAPEEAVPARHDAARSPRSTRGATRA